MLTELLTKHSRRATSKVPSKYPQQNVQERIIPSGSQSHEIDPSPHPTASRRFSRFALFAGRTSFSIHTRGVVGSNPTSPKSSTFAIKYFWIAGINVDLASSYVSAFLK